ncbi:glycosyltransferase family 39 protein [Hoeflea sp. EC-HK425]|mgnify:CR=1 FL=1|uniref:ArnT family glycosyltransferase n=1 Tax=Hoeflea sp. EC-HK425 TaxID=2038388 RepID=UPI001258F487|nr:glycosyltransferase family 39 protein [Hoeflea sp. EC-HK425]VVT17127.1 Dolichyl-phosphate-mannose--protein mannosyltransferase [Hoeflea sp. EC-HK425]
MVAVKPEATGVGLNNTVRKTSTFSLTHSERQVLIAILCVLLVVRILAMFWYPFVDSTEARYAEIARKMVETGDWITPQFDYGVPFWGKPPLHTWMSALGMKIFGVGHFGARFFFLIASLGLLWLCYVWVRRVRGADQALVAMAVIATAGLFYGASAFVVTDMAMVLGTTMSMAGFYVCLTDRSAHRLWGYLFFVGLAVGLLAKGPVAVVLTGIPIFLWIVVGNRWRQLFRLPWITGLLVTALIALPWYLVAEAKTPGFLNYFIVGEHYKRFLETAWQGDLYGSAHARPKGMIWAYGTFTFLPWSFFVLALMLRSKQVLDVLRKDQAGWYSYLFFWSLSPLILFTPAANILPAYVLPGIPAAAILLVAVWSNVFGPPGRMTRLWGSLSMISVAVIVLGLATVAFFLPNTLNVKSERELVLRALEASPDIAITYWADRSYSAEFYAQGRVSYLMDPDGLRALNTNNVRDALAVSSQDIPNLRDQLEAGFVDVGRFGRRHLFIEPSPQ